MHDPSIVYAKSLLRVSHTSNRNNAAIPPSALSRFPGSNSVLKNHDFTSLLSTSLNVKSVSDFINRI